jgi:signal peptidase II
MGRLSAGLGRRRLLLVLGTAGVVVALDQLTKSLAVHYLSSGPVHLIGNGLELNLGYNSGVAFSLGRGLAPELVLVALVLIAVLMVMGRSAPTTGTAIAVGFVLGGAIGNLSDRLFRSHHGAVVDFIYTRFWPTFNVADSCITVGGLLLLLLMWRRSPAVTGKP